MSFIRHLRFICKILRTIKGEREKHQWEVWDESLLANCFSPALNHSGFPWTIQCRQSELRSRLIKRLWKSPIISLMALSTQASSYLEWYPNWKGHRFSHEERDANSRSAMHSEQALPWLILKRINSVIHTIFRLMKVYWPKLATHPNLTFYSQCTVVIWHIELFFEIWILFSWSWCKI